ncbi:uncharacterized protein ASCRUDRAFT_72983 [Ascoidea rubescens DSM 1968]|uniref:Uncharacterized protein n=1 Tax=Ascoidea rubescens DSM 1968 TaxID=1344418 RepID=A0A1D2V8Q1_9ASCO|nr:hypothetical protein ASCRUDRAFT_72983 [Ascoidea rubescens DSM 1968]ODV57979.1 hypothetical protein ASCRUDRAFT_72983 [Ascoidea rubescens DSM 1968]
MSTKAYRVSNQFHCSVVVSCFRRFDRTDFTFKEASFAAINPKIQSAIGVGPTAARVTGDNVSTAINDIDYSTAFELRDISICNDKNNDKDIYFSIDDGEENSVHEDEFDSKESVPSTDNND